VLNVRSGFLSTRTTATVEESGNTWTIRLGNPQVYARILELGGRTAPHLIRPRRPGGVLRFQRGGETVFARLVRHPGSLFKPRPTLRPALDAEGAKLGERIDRARAALPAGPVETV
jgi:hypothetical protein